MIVMPAKAGIQSQGLWRHRWIPACAGMTTFSRRAARAINLDYTR